VNIKCSLLELPAVFLVFLRLFLWVLPTCAMLSGRQMLSIDSLMPIDMHTGTRHSSLSNPSHCMILQVFPTPVHILGRVIMARWKSSSFLYVHYKGKGKVHPITGHNGPEEEQMYSCTLPSTSVLDGVGGQRHAPATLPPGKDPVPFV
jgi:hypothetical protein